jgi:hypothetical protein
MEATRYVQCAFILLLSCNSEKKTPERNNHIQKIYFEVLGGYCKCPPLALRIDSSLVYSVYIMTDDYYENDSMTKGLYTGKASQGYWDTLNMMFEKVDYTHLGNKINQDRIAATFYLYLKNRIDTILGINSRFLPERMTPIYYQLRKLCKKKNLNHSLDSSLFSFYHMRHPDLNLRPPIVIRKKTPKIIPLSVLYIL